MASPSATSVEVRRLRQLLEDAESEFKDRLSRSIRDQSARQLEADAATGRCAEAEARASRLSAELEVVQKTLAALEEARSRSAAALDEERLVAGQLREDLESSRSDVRRALERVEVEVAATRAERRRAEELEDRVAALERDKIASERELVRSREALSRAQEHALQAIGDRNSWMQRASDSEKALPQARLALTAEMQSLKLTHERETEKLQRDLQDTQDNATRARDALQWMLTSSSATGSPPRSTLRLMGGAGSSSLSSFHDDP